ncbi:MAG: hypothetical protein H5T86_00610 [Armatimonadetes bacterium]|nr:hypothetical protein [Armatimonadota bacterium]
MQMTAPVSLPEEKATHLATANSRLDFAAASLSASDFLTLLIAELKNQDPLNPLDPREMMTQLAQLQTVAELRDIKNTLSDTSSPPRNIISLLGRTVWWEDQAGNAASGRVQRIMYTPEGWRLFVDGQFIEYSRVLGIGE